MPDAWVSDAQHLARSVAAVTGVTPEVTWHTDRLVEYRFVPPNDAAAPLSLFVSASEVVFVAGAGARVELGRPSDCVDEVEDLARSVAAGKLSEIIEPRRVKFFLDLGDGTESSGTSRLRRDKRRGPRRSVTYEAYGSS